jgi:NAD(P)-dependent dehydrogenase (short-subunit alcohol dehydrogenase family)
MKTVLVTGASSGMGMATAQKLVAKGYRVYAAARRVERMRELEELGVRAIRMDISVDDDIVAAVDRMAAEQGGVDVLVNSAGFGSYGAMEDTPLDEARYQFEVNMFGLARLTQLTLPHMREQRSGVIVNVSSMGGRIYTPLGSWYHATKHALEGWSDCLRIELAPFGIRVVIVEPGAIETEWGAVATELVLQRSGETAYADQAQRVAARMRASYAPGKGSPPSLVADTIAGAIESDRPKTRYAVGKYARSMIAMRKWLGDRAFDRILRLM